MSAPLVTISSAFYNTGPAILDMLRSVFAQTFSDWELVLIDDGSTDETAMLAASVKDPRIRIYRNERNRGRSYSLNRITEVSRGKYIARMDSDDLCSPERIRKQVELLESEPTIDAAGTGMCYLDRNGMPLGDGPVVRGHAQICKNPNRGFRIAHGTLLGKKSWFEKHPYDENLKIAIDFNLFYRSYRDSVFDNVPEPLYYYNLDQSFHLKKQFAARKNSVSFLFAGNWNEGRYGAAIGHSVLQYLKFGLTVGCFCTGLRGRLMTRRFGKMSEAKKTHFLQELDYIRSIRLPGIEEV
jgi:glycosyltransferase involved in cell wall biosynthesis